MEELNTLGSRQLVTRDVVRLSFSLLFSLLFSLPGLSFATLFSLSLRPLPRDSLKP